VLYYERFIKMQKLYNVLYIRCLGSQPGELLTALEMEWKVKDIEMAKYWREQGYSFDPNFMTAGEMTG